MFYESNACEIKYHIGSEIYCTEQETILNIYRRQMNAESLRFHQNRLSKCTHISGDGQLNVLQHIFVFYTYCVKKNKSASVRKNLQSQSIKRQKE